MEITFLRLGYANNSSSSHSLIFTGDKNIAANTNETSDFGWQTFICANRIGKRNYLLGVLKYMMLHKLDRSLQGMVYLGHPNNQRRYMGGSKESSVFINTFKARLIRKQITAFKEWPVPELVEALMSDINVDHQSAELSVPIHRINKCIDYRILNILFNTLLNENFVFLGGNDNEDKEIPKHIAKLSCDHPIKAVWNFLYRSTGVVMTGYDRKTGEYLMSKYSGPIMKFKA